MDWHDAFFGDHKELYLQQDDRLPDALRGLWPGGTPGTSAE